MLNLCKRRSNIENNYNNENINPLDEKSYRLGYAWFATTKSMRTLSDEKWTVDPRLSYSQARDR